MEGLKGLKGLTPEDRQNWEKSHSSQLEGLTPDQTDRVYRNFKFKEKFGDRPDYNTLKSYTPEQRDSLYNGGLFQAPQETDEEQQKVDSIGKAFQQGQDYQTQADRLTELYNNWPARGRKALDEFDRIATDVSPYYKRYKGTEYLPFSDEDKYRLAAEYNAAKSAYGEQEANNMLRRQMQNTASENQSVFEKIWNGFKGMGAQTAGALIGAAGMVKGAVDYIGDERNGNMDNAALDFMDHVIDNDWTRYGNDVMQYGSLFDADIQEAKDNGGLSAIPIIRTVKEEQGSVLDNLLSVNTIPELVNQQGFTIASMLTGAGLSSISNKAFQGLKGAALAADRANTLNNLEKVNGVLRGLQQARQKVNAFVIPAMVGTVEGVSEGLDTKIRFLDDARQMVAENQAKAVNDEFNRRLQNPEELGRQGYNPRSKEDLERLYKEIYDSYAPQYEESIKKAEANAAKAGVYTMGLNSMINGALNMTLKAGLQTPSVQEAMRRSRLGRLFTPQDFRVEAGRVIPDYGKVSKVLDVLQEPAGEFTEEYLQSVSDAFARGGAEYNLQNFIVNKYKGDGKNAVDESLANDLFAASRAAGDAMTDKETVLSGIYGALASGMGTPTINNRRGPAVRMEDESKLDYTLRRSPIVYRNPVYEAIQEQRSLGEERATAAQVMTDWIQDPANKGKYDGLVGTFNWAKAMDEASGKNDEFEYRNSESGKTINDVMMLEKIRGTDYYNSFMTDLTNAANAEDGSELARSLVRQFKNAPNNRDIQQDDSQILETIKKNSNKLLDTMSRIAEESGNIDRMLGNAADEDTKQALIYGKMSVDSWRERAAQLEDELSKVPINPTTSSNLSEAQRDALISYGTQDKIDNAYDELAKKKDELKKDIENITKRKNLKVNEEPALRAKRAALKTIDKQLRKLGRERDNSIEGTVLGEADIMSLNPVDRAVILNPGNKSKYSEEQRAVIDNVIREGTLQYSDFIDKIEDAGRINLAQQAYLAQYNSILSDPSSFNAFTARIKRQVADDNTRKKYEYLNGVSDYPAFVRNLDKAYRESDVRERSVIGNILKDNDNYNRYIADNKALEGIFDQLDSNEKFNSLSKNDKNVIMTSMQFLTDRGISPTDASIDVLAETDESGNSELLNYIGEVNGRLSEGEQMAPSSVEEIAQTLNDILEEYNKNITEVETINKPVEVAPTTTEDSKPPEPVGVFAQLAANPEMGASGNLEEDTPAESVGIFGGMERTPSLTGTIEPEVESLVDKFKTNSNEEVAEAADIGSGIIDNASDIYNDVKGQAAQILDELGDSEYETPDDLSEAIMAKANQLQVQSQQGGDNPDRVSSLLKQVASKIKVRKEARPDSKEERAATPDTVDEERRNNGLITTASVDNYPDSVVGQASRNFRMNDYLRKGNMTPKTPIMFIADPAIIAGVKQEMGEAYNENDHLPIMAVVEDDNGPVIIDDKKYQPIGFMPGTSAHSQGAARVEPLRMSALTQQDGKLIKDKDGKVVTTNGYVRANPPQHTKAGTPNTLIHTIMSNDMDASDRAKMNDARLSIQDRQAVYRKAKDKILPNIRRVAQDAKGERIHLAYFTPNMKGGESEFELYVTTPQNSLSRTGQPIAQVLTEGTPEEILKANSRLHRYGRTLEEFFKKKPFSDDIRFKREGDTLIAIGEGAARLSSLGESLTKKLSNYLTVPKGYEYTFIPTEDKLEGNRMYQLVLTDGVNTIPMARVTNGTMTDETKADAIKSLILDNGDFRQDGSQPFVKWQVNYNDFNAKEGESDDAGKARSGNAGDIFDDNILESSRTSFKYTVRGIDINSPFKQDGSRTPVPTQVVANQVNATQGKPINTPVIVATDQVKVGDAIVDSETGATLKGEVKPVSDPAMDKARQTADRIVEDSKKIRLADDNSGYVDNNGVRYARVTSIIQADEHAGERFDPASPWIIPSTNIGTSVDEFVRDFFAGEFFDEDGKLLNDYHFDYPNASQSQWMKFANQLMGLKNYIDAQGLTVIPRDVTVTGTVKVTDTQGQTHDIPVAGTLDLLAYDTQGNFHIFDMKTNRSGISDGKRRKYAKQVSMYQKFIEDKYGIKTASLNIIPINVSYPAPLGSGNGKTVYEISEGNQLLADGEEYMDSKPTLEEIGAVPFTDVNIQYDKLTDSEKQMIADMLPAEVEVKKVEIPDAGTTVNRNLGLKMGKVKNRFAKPAKKGPIVTPSANNWESISDEARQAAITMGYTKESWNNMTEDEKRHQKECLNQV